VIFDGEEAVDAGGVTKEFFLLLLKERKGSSRTETEAEPGWTKQPLTHLPEAVLWDELRGNLLIILVVILI
jgi:hypothetical protein